jgi:hypothetical protein
MIQQRTNTNNQISTGTTNTSGNGIKRSLSSSSPSPIVVSHATMPPVISTSSSSSSSGTSYSSSSIFMSQSSITRRHYHRSRFIVVFIVVTTLFLVIIPISYYYTNHTLRIINGQIFYNSHNNNNDKESQHVTTSVQQQPNWYDTLFHRTNGNRMSHDDHDHVQGGGWNDRNRNKKKEYEIMKYNAQQNQNIFQNENHTITIDDLKDIISSSTGSSLPSSNDTSTTTSSSIIVTEEMIQERQPILDILNRTGLQIDTSVIPYLPKWEQVTQLYGNKPIIYGLEQCQIYQQLYPNIEQRYIGVAGQMNTGTNALTKYLMNNIQLLKSKSSRTSSESTTNTTTTTTNNGILWTVPWYKHSWISLFDQYHYQTKQLPNHIPHQQVMAIILIRDPYFWMYSYTIFSYVTYGTYVCTNT